MLARLLLPEGRGELASVMLWPPVLATIGLIGLAEATAFHAARRTIERGNLFASAVAITVGLSLILLPMGWLVVDHVSAGFTPQARSAA